MVSHVEIDAGFLNGLLFSLQSFKMLFITEYLCIFEFNLNSNDKDIMMKWILGLVTLLLSTQLFAAPPVTLSEPSPPISAVYASQTATTVTYRIVNNVPKQLPLTVGGLSDGLSRTTVTNDCGNTLPAGPAACNIGITISPLLAQAGSSVNQMLVIDFEGRTPLTTPISFSVIHSLAYVSPAPSSHTIYQFLLNPVNGDFLSSGTPTYTDLSQSYNRLTFATTSGVQYAYPVDQSGFVYQCTIADDGTFSSCDATPASPPSWAPYAIDFATSSGVQYGYVTDVGNGNVFQCSLNSDGSFNACPTATGLTFPAPYGITFATVGGVQYAYIADAGTGVGFGNAYQCTLNSDGSINSCSITPASGAPGWIPYQITFETVNGTQYAYVADNGTTPTGNVYQCTLNNDGSFNICTTTPSSPPSSNWVPADIAFTTLNGSPYAYVANYQGASEGGMYVCPVNSDGSFGTCNSTPSSPPVSPFQPVGIAFRN